MVEGSKTHPKGKKGRVVGAKPKMVQGSKAHSKGKKVSQ
jgi:hypothetical protein